MEFPVPQDYTLKLFKNFMLCFSKIYFSVAYSRGYFFCISKNAFPRSIFPWLRLLYLKNLAYSRGYVICI